MLPYGSFRGKERKTLVTNNKDITTISKTQSNESSSLSSDKSILGSLLNSSKSSSTMLIHNNKNTNTNTNNRRDGSSNANNNETMSSSSSSSSSCHVTFMDEQVVHSSPTSSSLSVSKLLGIQKSLSRPLTRKEQRKLRRAKIHVLMKEGYPGYN